MTSSAPTAAGRGPPLNDSPRRADLDALRILAFGTLILFHVGLVYVSWDAPIKSTWASPAAEPLLLITAPWRLLLLFLISGAATRFLWDKSPSPAAFAAARFARLLPPLLLGALLLAPLTAYWAYLARAEAAAMAFGPFWGSFFGLGAASPPAGVTPGLVHVWFVLYLAAYTLVLFMLLGVSRLFAWSWRRDGAAHAWVWLLAPPVVLAVLRRLLFDRFGATHAFPEDWYNHVVYGGFFLLGFLIAKAPGFWMAVARLRWPALQVAALSYAAYIPAYLHLVHAETGVGPVEAWLERGLRSLFAWSAIVAALAWAQHCVHRRGPLMRYFGEAVFPYYLLHQPILVLACLGVFPLQLPWPIEAAALIVLTLAGTAASYELVRRSGPLRPLFGLKATPPGRLVAGQVLRGAQSA